MLTIDQLEINLLPFDIPVTVVRDISEVRPYIPAMLGYLRRTKLGGALTGPQVGLAKRLIVTYLPDDCPRILINPVVVGFGNTRNDLYEHVSIHALNPKNEQITLASTKGYYKGREQVGRRFAEEVQNAYNLLELYSLC